MIVVCNDLLSPSGFIIELSFFQELANVCSFNTSRSSGIGVSFGMKVVVMDMFWVVLTLPGVLFDIEATIWNIVPSCLGLISKENVRTILVLKPSPHLLRKHPNMFVIWTLMKPMVQWALIFIGIGVYITWEPSLKSRNHIVELEGVC